MSRKLTGSPAFRLLAVVALVLTARHAWGQRHLEKLGRGLMAVRANSTQVYVGWRLLSTDPDGVGFNLYRSASGGAGVKLNSRPLTNTTDYLDGGANLSVSNAWYVRAISNGFELTPSAAGGLPANAPIRQYFPVPLHAVTGGAYPPYDLKFAWAGDFDGDGEYDFVVDRLSTTAGVNQYLQAYLRDGTLLWQMDMGYNSTNQYSHEPGSAAISIGMGDCVTVFDLDGNGKAEVVVRTARGVTVTNAAGARVAAITAANDTIQYISVFEGMTGVELARATVPNPYSSDGPLFGHMGVMYCDGVQPSVVYEGWNRVGSTYFNLNTTTWDYRNGALTQRWTWNRGSQNAADFHQIRIADVDHDGKDELCQGAYVIDDNGQLLFTTGLVHGDRFHLSDLDPSRPGLETFAIQQDNPSMLGMVLYDSATGEMLKKWYQTGVGDVARGIAIDIDPNYKGCEMYSTMGGIYNCRGDLITATTLWAPEGIWWDADFLREFEDGAGSGGYNPVINKYNPITHNADRLYSIYSDGGIYVVRQAYGGRAAFWGDLIGDWREELVLVASDYSQFRIYTTKLVATNRLVTLMHDPAYRCQATTKGYYQANYPDFYLGQDMPPPVPMPFSDAQLVWRGDGTNLWDVGVTANWVTNWYWSTNLSPVVFHSGDTVLFDLTGSNHAAIRLAGALAPGGVAAYAPTDFTFSGDGSLSGAMKLTKAGKGRLALNTSNDFTGATLVAEGPLIVNGSLSASPVTVRGGVWHDGRIGGNGFLGGGVRVEFAGGISPGNGADSPGTLTISNGVVEAGGAVNCFDLSDDPSGATGTNDLLRVIGDLTLLGTNEFAVRLLGTNPPPGVYPLITYSGTFHGALSNQTISGLEGFPAILTNPPGQIALQVSPVRPPTTLTWAGGLNQNAWDLLTTSNWLNGAARDRFNPQDVVRFTDSGAANPTVSLVGRLSAGGLVVDSASNYTFTGSGVLMGRGGLAKSNTGTLVISNTAHTFTGPTLVAGGLLAVARLNEAGQPSSIGAAAAAATNLVLAGGTLRLLGDDAYTDRGITLSAGTNTLDIPSSTVQLTLVGQVTGAGKLAKTGPGLLLLNASNSFAGGTVLKAGRILLGSATANSRGLGSGTVTLEGGTLSMSDVRASETAAWDLVVPTGASARLDVDGRSTLTGALTGGGTLTVYTPYVRTDFSGNWSSFTGLINVTTSGTNSFRCKHSAGYPHARLNLASAHLSLQSRLSGTSIIPIGELAGVAGSYLSAPIGSSGNDGLPVVWQVGGLNTAATFAGNSYDDVGFIKVGAGAWTWTGANYHRGANTVSNGALLVMGNAAAATGVFTVAAAGTLGGTGIIGGTTTVYGTLSPGSNAIGTITFTNHLTLAAGSATVVEINKDVRTHDLVSVGGILKQGGTLRVTNLTGTLAPGDSFKLFNAGSYAGSFASMSLPPLPPGQGWNTSQLPSSGTLWVVATHPPVLGAPRVSGSNFTFAGTSGTPGWEYLVLASTNANLPLALWTAIATNRFDTSGNFIFTGPMNPSQQFYCLQVP